MGETLLEELFGVSNLSTHLGETMGETEKEELISPIPLSHLSPSKGGGGTGIPNQT